MGGAQSQLLPASQISLWSRVRDIQITDVEEAMAERKLVKAACMRRTLFLVPSRDLAIFVRGSARRAEKEIRLRRSNDLCQLSGRALSAILLSVKRCQRIPLQTSLG